MTDDQFKRELVKFRNSCRVYHKEVEKLESLDKQFPALAKIEWQEGIFKVDLSEDFGNGNLELYQLLKDDVRYVNTILDLIEEQNGPNARVLIWSLFVDNRIQVDVAEEFGLTRRQLQYSVDKWLHAAFEAYQKIAD